MDAEIGCNGMEEKGELELNFGGERTRGMEGMAGGKDRWSSMTVQRVWSRVRKDGGMVPAKHP